MYKKYILTGLFVICSASVLSWVLMAKEKNLHTASHTISNAQKLMHVTIEKIRPRTSTYVEDFKHQIAAIIAIPEAERTYENIFLSLDRLLELSDLIIWRSVCSILEMVSPDEAIRKEMHEILPTISATLIDLISNNVDLYQTCKNTALALDQSLLTKEQRYFIKQTIEGFERAGLQLPKEERAIVTQLKKEIATLGLNFDYNIAADATTVPLTEEELTGVELALVDTLKRRDRLYLATLDYPTVNGILTTCTVSNTRKKIYKAFNNRAYPINQSILETLFAKRNQLAKLLNFEDYATLDLVDQMIKTPKKAKDFLYNLIERAQEKTVQEFASLRLIEHPSIVYTDDGKLQPWDVGFVRESYRKKYHNLDEEELKKYFPMQSTMDGLLTIYQQFFGLVFKKINLNTIWHDMVQALQVFDQEDKLLGTLLLDLHPRQGKYTHACQCTIIQASISPDGSRLPGLALVIANFPHPTHSEPSLWKLNDVRTFFHEFGHALHSLMGATPIATLSGTNTKTDFVEMPSQLLEEWLWDKSILRNISKHYLNNQPLPDEMIDSIVALKNFDTGFTVQRQSYLSLLSLSYHQIHENLDLAKIMRELSTSIITNIAFDDDSHFYTSFGHLNGYGAKYYGYFWSKVFALDIFDTIRTHGLLNNKIGSKYIDTILSKGGTQEPEDLLINFLGRKPSSDAFFRDMGL